MKQNLLSFGKIFFLSLFMMSPIYSVAQNIVRQSGKVFHVKGESKCEIDTTSLLVHVDVNKMEHGSSLKVNKLGFYTINVPINKRVENFVDSLMQLPWVKMVEYNYFGHYQSFNDPDFSYQWYYSDYDFDDIHDNVPTSPYTIIMAVLDSGFDFNHLGLGVDTLQNKYGALYVNSSEIPCNGLDDDNDGYVDNYIGWNFEDSSPDINNISAHGTSVFGLIGAGTNDSIGTAGLIGTRDDIKLMPLVTGGYCPQSTYVAEAIIYAVDHDARIIQMSLSVPQTNAVDAAISYAKSNGVLIVCAAGNNGMDPYPGNHNDVVGVGSVDSYREHSSFSNGNTIDVVAPGEDIYAPRKHSINGCTFVYDYDFYDGTSFSSPIVSTLAAYIMAQNPFLTAEDVRCVIDTTSIIPTGEITYMMPYLWDNNYNCTKPYSNLYGFGIINPSAAISTASNLLPYYREVDRIVGSDYNEIYFDLGDFHEFNTYYADIVYEPLVEYFPNCNYVLSVQIEYVSYHFIPYYIDDGSESVLLHFDFNPNVYYVPYVNLIGIIKDRNGIEIHRFSQLIHLTIPSQSLSNISLSNGVVSNEIIFKNENYREMSTNEAIVTIYSVDNRIVSRQKVDMGQSEISIDVSSLNKGHYLVKVMSNGEDVFNGHVIKVK